MSRLLRSFVVVSFCALLSGCASFKFTTTIHKVENAEALLPAKTTFKIVSTPRTCSGDKLMLSGITEGYIPKMIYAKKNTEHGPSSPAGSPQAVDAAYVESVLPGMLMETAIKRYPGIFADSPDSLPLVVTVDRKFSSPDPTASMLLTILSAFIIPSCVSESSTFNIGVHLAGMNATAGRIGSAAFERRDTMMLSLIPLFSWVPVPGPAERKLTNVGINDMTPYDIGAQITLESMVDATMVGLTRPGRERFANLVANLRQADTQAKRAADERADTAIIQTGQLPPPTWPLEAVAIAPLMATALSSGEARSLTDQLRMAMVQSKYFKVVSREDMMNILKEQQFQKTDRCDDTQCLVEMGKLLAVQKNVGGIIGKVGSTYTLSLNMVNIESGQIEYSVARRFKGEPDQLITLLEEAAKELALQYGRGRK